jgi:predicted acyl esterase
MGRAPDPLIVGERWRAMWLERLEAMTPVYGTWLSHQTRDGYWKHGSVGEDIGAITCAVFAVGGWADGYTNTVFRLLRDLKAPKLGLVGPWGHKYPHNGVPGPAIGFLSETLRWWDHWLKGADTGIMQEPMLRAYVQDSVPPASHYDSRPGRWVAEPAWPPKGAQSRRFYLNKDGLGDAAGKAAMLPVNSPQTTGIAGGEWCPYGLGGLGPELPTDQRADDAFSLVFDGTPLSAPLEFLGATIIELELESDQPVAQLIARLNDVAPDGQVTRVTYGVLNLTHRDGHAEPRPLAPGQRYKVRLQLNDAGHRFAAGHWIRLALSTAYWPIVWPAPKAATITVHAGASSLLLPERSPRAEDAKVKFGPPEKSPPTKRTVMRAGKVCRRISYDVESGRQHIEVLRDDGRSRIEEIGVTTDFHKMLHYDADPKIAAEARASADHDIRHSHDQGWDTCIRTHCAVACTEQDFIVEADLEAFEGERRIFSRSWTEKIPRRLG